MNYRIINNKIEHTDTGLTKDSENCISVITNSVFINLMEKTENPIGIIRNNETRYTKLDVHSNYLQGVIYMPNKKEVNHHIRFGYIIYKSNILFIDDTHTVHNIIRQIQDSTVEIYSIWKFFYHFVDILVAPDLLYLQEIENFLSSCEGKLLDNGVEQFKQKDIIVIRKRIFNQYRYYTQLLEIEHRLDEIEYTILSKRESKLFDLFSNKVNRLKNEVQILRDYSMQIQDLYESQINRHQNDIMKVLTIVTTLVLPLSLIAGWYGMNFRGMPELSWKYGYPVCIILSILVIVVSLYLFKKNKFL